MKRAKDCSAENPMPSGDKLGFSSKDDCFALAFAMNPTHDDPYWRVAFGQVMSKCSKICCRHSLREYILQFAERLCKRHMLLSEQHSAQGLLYLLLHPRIHLPSKILPRFCFLRALLSLHLQRPHALLLPRRVAAAKQPSRAMQAIVPDTHWQRLSYAHHNLLHL